MGDYNDAKESFEAAMELDVGSEDLKKKYPEYNLTPSNPPTPTSAEKNAQLRALNKAVNETI